MTQLAQAKGILERADQGFSEVRADFTAFLKRYDAGEVSKELFDSTREEFEAKLSQFDEETDRANALNTIGGRFDNLAPAMGRPLIVRPQVGDRDGGASEFDRPTSQELAAGAEGSRDTAQILSGRARTLLSKYLRPTGISMLPNSHAMRASLTTSDMQYLTAGRGDQLMSAFVDSSGAFMTAEEFRNELIMVRAKVVDIVSRVRTISTTATRVAFPTAKIAVSFTKRGHKAEAKIATTTLKDIFGKTAFTPEGKDLIVKVPMQLVEDATFDIIGHLSEEIDRESRENDEDDILNGTGASEALGILTGLKKLFDAGFTGVAFPATSGSGYAGAAFTEDDIQVWDVQLHAAATSNASILGPRIFEEKVRLFRTKEGGANTGEYLFKRALALGAPNTLNGFPLLRSEFFPDKITAGSAGDILAVMVDLRDFWWVTRSGLDVRVLDQLYAETSEVGYMYSKRQDGAMVRADAAIYLPHR